MFDFFNIPYNFLLFKKCFKEKVPLLVSRTFCSWIWALTTRYSADGGFWLATSSSVSLSQLSRGSRASWNFPQCNRASCSWAIRSATWGQERRSWVKKESQKALKDHFIFTYKQTNGKSCGWIRVDRRVLNGTYPLTFVTDGLLYFIFKAWFYSSGPSTATLSWQVFTSGSRFLWHFLNVFHKTFWWRR